MPVPIVNVMVVVLRNSLAPINRVITNVCTKGPKHEEKLGFIFFKQFGSGCYYSEAAMNRFLTSGGKGTHTEASAPSDKQLFRIGVEWWSEIFIFYGLLSAIAIWEIGKFAKKSRYQLQRVDNLEKNHEIICN